MPLFKKIVFILSLIFLTGTPAISVSETLPAKFSVIPETNTSKTICIPDWVTHIPQHCFVGISSPCQTIEKARQQALNSAISQILQALGAEYRLSHESRLFGNAKYAYHQLDERLAYSARWFIRSIQQNQINSKIHRIQNRFIFFTLIHLPPVEMENLRKLTIGPKVTAKIIKKNHKTIAIEVSEINGVQVTLTDYHVKITAENLHAALITLFAWKVPELSKQNFKRVIDQKIFLKGSSKTFNITNPSPAPNLKKFILGTQTQISIVLHGYDEVGRQLSVTVQNSY